MMELAGDERYSRPLAKHAIIDRQKPTQVSGDWVTRPLTAR